MSAGGGHSRRPGHTSYIAHVVPGLEAVAIDELNSRLSDCRLERTVAWFDERASLLLLGYAGPPGDLLRLGTVEDVFVLLAAVGSVPSGREGLASIRSAVTGARDFGLALDLHRQLRPRRGRTSTYRVVARESGRHAFRRVDVQTAVEAGVRQLHPSWRLVEDRADLEIWAHLVGDELVVGLRLSDETMRQRTYKTVSLPASLKPTIAHAMVRLSVPEPEDLVLDPMCGVGTIPIERARAGRYRLLLAGDLDAQAVAAARENVGPRYKPISIQRWDATRLPLADGSVSKAISNLPFGRQIGSRTGNWTLYPGVLRELNRVVRPGGRVVLLTGDRSLLERSLQEAQAFHLSRQIPLLVRGFPATIYVLEKAR